MSRKKKILKTTEPDIALNDSNKQEEPIRIFQVELGDADLATGNKVMNKVKETIDGTYRELGK